MALYKAVMLQPKSLIHPSPPFASLHLSIYFSFCLVTALINGTVTQCLRLT